MKKLFKALGIVLLVLILAVVGLFGYLTLTEYKPAAVEDLVIDQNRTAPLDKQTFTVLSWNVGYCALGEESDFFMDGGKEVRPESRAIVDKNFGNILTELKAIGADFTFLQEVDSGSTRSYGMDQVAQLREELGQASAYALNFCTDFVPYPVPPIGRVRSGLLTLSTCQIAQAQRLSLPCPFSWPVSTANLKRCMLVSRIPLADQQRELVLVNFHLEAYDDGEGKLAQTRQLLSLLEEEYGKGNYVLAGGDWNQIFPLTEDAWPNTHKDLWTPGVLREDELAEGWRFYWDDSVPTCRLLNQPYDPADTENTQYYVIDGFLASPNLTVEACDTLDEGFRFSDHNPVLIRLTMGE